MGKQQNWYRGREQDEQGEPVSMAKVRQAVRLASQVGERALETSPFFGPGMRLLSVFISVPWEEVPRSSRSAGWTSVSGTS